MDTAVDRKGRIFSVKSIPEYLRSCYKRIKGEKVDSVEPVNDILKNEQVLEPISPTVESVVVPPTVEPVVMSDAPVVEPIVEQVIPVEEVKVEPVAKPIPAPRGRGRKPVAVKPIVKPVPTELVTPQVENEEVKSETVVYTVESIRAMHKSELFEFCTGLGLAVTTENNKDELVEAACTKLGVKAK